MKKIKIKNYLVLVVILTSLIVSTKNTEACLNFSYPPFFIQINMICLDTEPLRSVYAEIIAHELRKVGIGVDNIERLSYEEIAQRTLDYDGTSPVPTHYEGGFDLLFMDRTWDFDVDPTPYFHSNATIPYGENIYQYENQEMDWALGNYTNVNISDDAAQMADLIQALFYEELPAITILYNYAFYYMKEDITGINTFLWNKKDETMAKWTHPTKSDLLYGINYEFEEFHPILSKTTSNKNDFQWLNQIFDSLIERNMDPPYNGVYSPNIATSYSSADGMTYNFELDVNAKWSDGTKINTTDVKYSFDLYENLTKPNNWNPLLEWNVYDVSIIDEHNIEIVLSSGSHIFSESKMAVPLMPYHIWKDIEYNSQAETARNWALNNPEKLVGAGPYKLENYDEENKIIHLVKNPYYKNLTNAEDPILNDIYFVYQPSKEAAKNGLAADQIDMIDSNFQIYPNEISIPGLYTKTILDSRSEEIVVNVKHPYIGTGALCPISSLESGKHLRKAISHAIPRTHIIETVLNGYAEPGITPWPLNDILVDEDLVPYEYSRDHINHGLEQAGFVYCGNYSSETSSSATVLFSSVCIVIIIYSIKFRAKKKKGNRDEV